MGLWFKIFKYYYNVLAVVTLVLAAILLTPGILPNISFEYYEVEPAVNLKPNSILNNAKVLIEGGLLVGPECIAIRGENELYTGVSTGKVLKYKDGKLSTVVQLGFPCDQLVRKECSHPLGMRFDNNGKLIVADMFGGILRVDVDRGTVETLVSRFDAIDGKFAGVTEDVSIAREGSVYWSDGTTVVPPENSAYSWLGNAKGRLLKYNPVTNTSQVLLENISFSNGVQLSDDEEFVLISDSMKFRILRHYLKGKKKGETDVFTSGLPGYPDNIRENGKGGFYVGIPVPRHQNFEIGKYPNACKLYLRVFYLAKSLNRYVYDLYPNDYLVQLEEFMNNLHFSLMFGNANSNGLIIELNNEGHIIGSLQNTNQNMNMDHLSHIQVGNKYAYLVSPFHDKIWQIERTHL